MSSTRLLPTDHPVIPAARPGVLLVNLGTPDAPTPKAVKKYLAEFLADPRIVELPRLLWLPILYGIILNTRPAQSAKAYAAIWRDNPPESPLRYFTRRQAEQLGDALGTQGDEQKVIVDWAMRYGSPSIAEKITALHQQGCDRILVIPLYPQYSATTTGSVHDAVFDAIKAMRWQPALRIAPAFHDDGDYIDALAAVAQRHLASLEAKPERIIISFHGLPERYFLAGDPYHCHCQKTARLLREKMGWSEEQAPLAFQSKFGRDKWIEPSTTDIIDKLADEGTKSIAVIMPGFTSDCIETLEEIDIAGREQFIARGGQHFSAIPCLNDNPEMIRLLSNMAQRELQGWIE